MYTAIKQAALEYYESEMDSIYSDKGSGMDFDDERCWITAINSAEYMTLEIIKIVLKKHPHLRKVFDEIEKDLAWKEHIKENKNENTSRRTA